jgi:hypothetical protein
VWNLSVPSLICKHGLNREACCSWIFTVQSVQSGVRSSPCLSCHISTLTIATASDTISHTNCSRGQECVASVLVRSLQGAATRLYKKLVSIDWRAIGETTAEPDSLRCCWEGSSRCQHTTWPDSGGHQQRRNPKNILRNSDIVFQYQNL